MKVHVGETVYRRFNVTGVRLPIKTKKKEKIFWIMLHVSDKIEKFFHLVLYFWSQILNWFPFSRRHCQFRSPGLNKSQIFGARRSRNRVIKFTDGVRLLIILHQWSLLVDKFADELKFSERSLVDGLGSCSIVNGVFYFRLKSLYGEQNELTNKSNKKLFFNVWQILQIGLHFNKIKGTRFGKLHLFLLFDIL